MHNLRRVQIIRYMYLTYTLPPTRSEVVLQKVPQIWLLLPFFNHTSHIISNVRQMSQLSNVTPTTSANVTIHTCMIVTE